jgi:hypothetical protein
LTKARHKVRGGKLIKVQLTAKGNTIEKIKITGDFFLHPEELVEEMEKMLEGQLLDERNLTEIVKTFIERGGATLLGASPEDFARCIMMAGEEND